MSEAKKQRLSISRKIIARQKILNITMNKIVFLLWLDSVCSNLVTDIIINKIVF